MSRLRHLTSADRAILRRIVSKVPCWASEGEVLNEIRRRYSAHALKQVTPGYIAEAEQQALQYHRAQAAMWRRFA